MAEIRVERKHKKSIWPWILGLLVAALLVWGLAETMDNDRDDEVNAARVSSLAPVTFALPAAEAAAPSVTFVRAA
jgi:hypothetical protein